MKQNKASNSKFWKIYWQLSLPQILKLPKQKAQTKL